MNNLLSFWCTVLWALVSFLCMERSRYIIYVYIPAVGHLKGTLAVCTPVAGTMTTAHSPLSCAPEFHCIRSGTQSIGTGTWCMTSGTNRCFIEWRIKSFQETCLRAQILLCYLLLPDWTLSNTHVFFLSPSDICWRVN